MHVVHDTVYMEHLGDTVIFFPSADGKDFVKKNIHAERIYAQT